MRQCAGSFHVRWRRVGLCWVKQIDQHWSWGSFTERSYLIFDFLHTEPSNVQSSLWSEKVRNLTCANYRLVELSVGFSRTRCIRHGSVFQDQVADTLCKFVVQGGHLWLIQQFSCTWPIWNRQPPHGEQSDLIGATQEVLIGDRHQKQMHSPSIADRDRHFNISCWADANRTTRLLHMSKFPQLHPWCYQHQGGQPSKDLVHVHSE